MLHDVLTNKWVLGCIMFVVILTVTVFCLLWYHWSVAPYKAEAERASRLLRQSRSAGTLTDTAGSSERSDEIYSSSGEMPITSENPSDKQSELISESKVESDLVDTDLALVPQKPKETKQRVSKFGLGPFPELPPDFPRKKWRNHYDLIGELFERVEVKLWEQGIRDIRGIGYDHHTGLIHLNRPGIVYVEYEYTETEDEINRYLHVCGSPISEEDIELLRQDKPVPGLTVLKMSDGIEPYSFLNLKK